MSEDALRWAKSTVWSRAFNVPYLGMIPPGTSPPILRVLFHLPAMPISILRHAWMSLIPDPHALLSWIKPCIEHCASSHHLARWHGQGKPGKIPNAMFGIVSCLCTCICTGGVGQVGIALVPVLDLLDHSPAAHVAWHTGASGTEPFQFITHSGARKVCALVWHWMPLATACACYPGNEAALLQRRCQPLHAPGTWLS